MHNTAALPTFQNGDLSCGEAHWKEEWPFSERNSKEQNEKPFRRSKRKSSDSLADTEVSFQSESESETVLSGRQLGLLSKGLADGHNYCRSLPHWFNCWQEIVSGASYLSPTCLVTFFLHLELP